MEIENNTQPQVKQGLSEDTKTIITVLLLLLFFPLGFILMWVWVKWPKWVKFLISLPIILGILGIIAAGLLIAINPLGRNKNMTPPQSIEPLSTQTIDTTANWKTYKNIKYGYELRYPSNWAVKEFGKLDPKTVDFVAFNPEVVKNEFSAVTISFSTRTYKQSLELGVQKSEPIKINNIDGVKKIETDPNGNKFVYAIFPLDQNTVTLVAKSEYEKLFDQILSTFKFTDQNQTIDTSNWKTYTNTKWSYSFKYPKELFERDGAIYTELPDPNLRPDTNMLMGTSVFTKSTYGGPKIGDPIGTRKEVADKTFDEITINLTLNNHLAIRMKEEVFPGSQTERVPGTIILVDLGSNFLYIWLPKTSEAELIKYNATFDQILSTFRFD